MKKLICLCIALFFLALCGCSEEKVHTHTWIAADCENPATCAECGETEGSALGHDWQDATCLTPMTCMVCQKTEGIKAVHDWQKATCTVKKTCEVCGRQEGPLLEHTVEDWTVEKEATCSEAGLQVGVCTSCGGTVEKNVDTIDHTPGEWVILQKATTSSMGERCKYCTVCDQQTEKEKYNLPPEEFETLYKKECKSYSYEEIARNPDKYKGEKAKLTGKVIQVGQQQTADGQIYYILRVGIKKGYSYYSNVVFVEYYASQTDPRILEDDIITMYGRLNGEITYESTMGASITIPHFLAEYIDIK